MKFKVGDKVLYKRYDKRHHINHEHLDKLILNKKYTILKLTLSNVQGIPVIITKEQPRWNYDITCFELCNKKLKIKLP